MLRVFRLQYHTYVRRREETNLQSLRQVRDLLRRRCTSETIGRKKVCEVVTILEHTAVSLSAFPKSKGIVDETRGINPTHGSHLRKKPADTAWDASRDDTESSRANSANSNQPDSKSPQQAAQGGHSMSSVRTNVPDHPQHLPSEQQQQQQHIPDDNQNLSTFPFGDMVSNDPESIAFAQQFGEDPNNIFTFSSAPFAGASMPSSMIGHGSSDGQNQLETFLPALTSDQGERAPLFLSSLFLLIRPR